MLSQLIDRCPLRTPAVFSSTTQYSNPDCAATHAGQLRMLLPRRPAGCTAWRADAAARCEHVLHTHVAPQRTHTPVPPCPGGCRHRRVAPITHCCCTLCMVPHARAQKLSLLLLRSHITLHRMPATPARRPEARRAACTLHGSCLPSLTSRAPTLKVAAQLPMPPPHRSRGGRSSWRHPQTSCRPC